MLNLLRSSELEFRQSCIEMMIAFGIAVCMVALLIVMEETEAQQKIAKHISHVPSFADTKQMDVVAESEAAKTQLELARLKSRVNYLTHRQEERDDLNDIQAILSASYKRQKGLMAELHSLHWEHGKLEFEGLSEDLEKWQSLMNDMMLFNRWKTAPQILHSHRAMTQPTQSGASLIEVKVKAHLWAHASNAPVVKSAP